MPLCQQNPRRFDSEKQAEPKRRSADPRPKQTTQQKTTTEADFPAAFYVLAKIRVTHLRADNPPSCPQKRGGAFPGHPRETGGKISEYPVK